MTNHLIFLFDYINMLSSPQSLEKEPKWINCLHFWYLKWTWNGKNGMDGKMKNDHSPRFSDSGSLPQNADWCIRLVLALSVDSCFIPHLRPRAWDNDWKTRMAHKSGYCSNFGWRSDIEGGIGIYTRTVNNPAWLDGWRNPGREYNTGL